MSNDMPDVMYVEIEQREFAFEEGEEFLDKWDVEKYHHDRIVQALKRENEQLCDRVQELKAKLDKAIDIIKDMEKGDDVQAFKEARKFIKANEEI